MEGKQRLEAFLRDNKVGFQIHHHPEAFTAQEVAAVEHLPGKVLGKVVVVAADDELALVVLPAPSAVDLDKVAPALGAKAARLAEESEFESRFPGCDTGAMPPFGNNSLYDVPVVVDRAVSEQDEVAFNACTHTDTVHLAYSDFARLVDPTVADVTD
ncbi:MAG: aminoacyl-tRNA deacylase [Actinomycetota bacterium]